MREGVTKDHNMHRKGWETYHLRAPGKRTTRGAVTREGRERCHTVEAEAKHPLIWRKRKRRRRKKR